MSTELKLEGQSLDTIKEDLVAAAEKPSLAEVGDVPPASEDSETKLKGILNKMKGKLSKGSKTDDSTDEKPKIDDDTKSIKSQMSVKSATGSIASYRSRASGRKPSVSMEAIQGSMKTPTASESSWRSSQNSLMEEKKSDDDDENKNIFSKLKDKIKGSDSEESDGEEPSEAEDGAEDTSAEEGSPSKEKGGSAAGSMKDIDQEDGVDLDDLPGEKSENDDADGNEDDGGDGAGASFPTSIMGEMPSMEELLEMLKNAVEQISAAAQFMMGPTAAEVIVDLANYSKDIKEKWCDFSNAEADEESSEDGDDTGDDNGDSSDGESASGDSSCEERVDGSVFSQISMDTKTLCCVKKAAKKEGIID